MAGFKLALLLIATLLLALAGWAGWARYSIIEEDVEFRSGDLVLRGTLLSPRLAESSPAVVLVHGSGEVSRRSMIAYAWLFAYKGYAALAYDKRGVGLSEGQPYEWREFDFDDLAGDASAAFHFVSSREGIDSDRVGFFGASQGGWVVALAATRVESPAFLIMASASVSTVAEDRLHGLEAQMRHAGFQASAIEPALSLLRADHEVTRSGAGYDSLLRRWQAYRELPWFQAVHGDTMPRPPNAAARKWEKTVLDFDPVPLLKQVSAPALWIFGDPALDRFSPVELSLKRIEQAIHEGACYQVLRIDGAGHTLELEDASAIRSLLTVRAPLVIDIYGWLDQLEGLYGRSASVSSRRCSRT